MILRSKISIDSQEHDNMLADGVSLRVSCFSGNVATAFHVSTSANDQNPAGDILSAQYIDDFKCRLVCFQI
jgi:hypothetical protein